MHVVIDTFGAKLSFDNGILLIETLDDDGNMQLKEIPFLHITSLHLHPNVRVSTNVLNYCINSGIPVFLENNLEVTGLIWSPRYGSISVIRKRQALYSYSSLKWALIKKILFLKNDTRIQWLQKTTRKQNVKSIIQTMQRLNYQINSLPDDEKKIRAWEAAVSKKFFEAFGQILPADCPFDKRTHAGAQDPVNALLNYGYGILYKEVTKAIIHAGLDPYTGFFHRDDYRHPALVYDMIEPYRVWVDQHVWKFCKQNPQPDQILDPETRLIRKQPRREFVKLLAQFMHKTVITRKGKRFTPARHITLDMQQLASYLQNLSHETLLNSIRHQ